MEDGLASDMQVTGLGIKRVSAAAGQEGLSSISKPTCSWGQQGVHCLGLGKRVRLFLLQSTVVDLSREEKGFPAANWIAE